MWQERRKILFSCYTNVASLHHFSNLCLFSVKYCKAFHLQASDSYSCETKWWCGEEKSLCSWTAHMSFTYFNCKKGVTSGTLLFHKGTNASINMSVCYMIHVAWFYLHWPLWGNVCMYRDFWPTLLTHQSPRCCIHSRGQRERERPQDTLYPLPCATSLSPCFLWAPAFAETCAPHIPTTYTLCTHCTARSLCECTLTRLLQHLWELRYGDMEAC